MDLVGREDIIETFENCLNLSESKLIALYGRRRVGKTFLIRKYFEKKTVFEIAGLFQGETQDQLTHFCTKIASYGYAPAATAKVKNWMQAFTLLEQYLNTLKGKAKKVIFIDEMPWFDTPKSKFLTMFERFWNQYCTKRNDLLLIICGSAASWMIKKILQNKGGLHNRVFERIQVHPFTLYETEKFLKAKGIVWDQYAITQLYMCTGGIPFYLDAVRKAESFAQFINRTCFKENGFLRTEYNELYASLFDDSANHETVMMLLAKSKKGITREEIVKGTKISSGGTLSKVLDELDKSGFIKIETVDKNEKAKTMYRLEDFYTMFYFQYIAKGKKSVYSNWNAVYASPTWAAWSGFAFERICFYHTAQIKKALNITEIETAVGTWQVRDEDRGAQIDMLLIRADRITNVIEMKFAKSEFVITKDYAKQLRNKLARYAEWTPRRILMLTMISCYGILENEHYKELVQKQITIKQLFTK